MAAGGPGDRLSKLGGQVGAARRRPPQTHFSTSVHLSRAAVAVALSHSQWGQQQQQKGQLALALRCCSCLVLAALTTL